MLSLAQPNAEYTRLLHSAQDFLTDYWDTLVYVEGTIYQMDEDNEELTSRQTDSTPPASQPCWRGAPYSMAARVCCCMKTRQQDRVIETRWRL